MRVPTPVLSFVAMAALLVVPMSQAEVLIEGPRATVTEEDVRQTMLTGSEEDRRIVMSKPESLRRVIDSTYLANAAAADARAHGFDKDPVVRARIDRTIVNMLAEAQVDHLIEQEEARADFPKAAKERYLAEPEKYTTPERIAASHILIKTGRRTDAEALALANELLQKLRAGEAGFEELAREFSEDRGTRAKGGSLSLFGRGKMVPPFEEAAFALKEPGDLSDPVKTHFGYHLIRLDELVPPEQLPFEMVEARIIKELKAEMARTVREEYMIGLRDDPAIRVDNARMEAFLANPGLE